MQNWDPPTGQLKGYGTKVTVKACVGLLLYIFNEPRYNIKAFIFIFNAYYYATIYHTYLYLFNIFTGNYGTDVKMARQFTTLR